MATALFVLALCAAPDAIAQAAAAKAAVAVPAEKGEKTAPVPDPLGRESPLGTVTGLSRAVRRGQLGIAARYLQRVPGGAAQAEELAGDVNELLDRYFTQPLTSLTYLPEGTLNDGLPADRERLPLTMDDRSAELFLVRVQEPGGGPVWLVSADSLARVPALLRSGRATPMERYMPTVLVDRTFFGITLAQWALLAASLVLPFVLLWTLARLVSWLAARRAGHGSARATSFAVFWRSVRQPLVLALAIATHLYALPWLGFSIEFRYAYGRLGMVAGVIVLAQLIWRLLSAALTRARMLALQHGHADTRSLILLGERVLKVVVVIITLLVLLGLAGVDTTTALAGLGIGGIALALGAQKTVENLLGGIFLLTDKALAIGDFCRVSDRLGWVEDVTLRSVRLRTLEQTLLSVPAGLLAQGILENFATRRKLVMQQVFRLRYQTTPAQLQSVLSGIRDILANHPRVERPGDRVHLVKFGAQSIELELFAYFTTADQLEFLVLQEELLLQVTTLVAAAGTGFAEPQPAAAAGAAAA